MPAAIMQLMGASKSAATFTAELAHIEELDQALFTEYADVITVARDLNREVVSFQSNKTEPKYRWYKYKEAFSASLVKLLLQKYDALEGSLLDPFAGAGTALFASQALGLDAVGIELLPVGHEIIRARLLMESESRDRLATLLRTFAEEKPWKHVAVSKRLPALRITEGAYPSDTEKAISRYLYACDRLDEDSRTVLRFALMCVQEDVSYTRKDGQYLRWDYRSGRRQGTRPFDKGRVLSLDDAVIPKLKEIAADTSQNYSQLFTDDVSKGSIKLYEGSCLDILPSLQTASFQAIVTSPPYCNRYDYTRTYALELALLGVTEDGIKQLRQEMLSCTVENRPKDLLSHNSKWSIPVSTADNQKLLQAILAYLEKQRSEGTLNNNGIPRMVRGYFYEMACVIYECSRVLADGSLLFMVNDNVKYAGAPIPVDLILSDIAGKLGFNVEAILVLPKGKGNSSQQMGRHGRQTLRKCVYVWRKIGP